LPQATPPDRALSYAYHETAISPNLLSASAPLPTGGLDPAVSIPAQRARTVADAVERHTSGQSRREETDTGAIDLTGAFADPSPGPAQPSAEPRAPEAGVAEPRARELGGEASGAEGPGTAESGTAGPGTEAPDAEGPDAGRGRAE